MKKYETYIRERSRIAGGKFGAWNTIHHFKHNYVTINGEESEEQIIAYANDRYNTIHHDANTQVSVEVYRENDGLIWKNGELV